MNQPDSSRTLGSLEIGRFLAASSVVFSHVLPDLSAHAADGHALLTGIAPPGPIAVEYFFVLSGFVMMLVHGPERGHLRAVPWFWWRRAARIYPLYWLALLVPAAYLYGSLDAPRLAGLLSLQPVGFPDFVPPAWSLRYEVSFYLVFGFWLLPWIGRPLLAIWVILVLWRCWWAAPFGWSHWPVPPVPAALTNGFLAEFLDSYDFYFFAGLLAGWAFHRFALRPPASLTALVTGLLALAYALSRVFWGYIYGRPFMRLELAFALATVIFAIARLEAAGLLRFGRWARRLGLMSYALYILHAPLMLLFDKSATGLKLASPALLALTFAVSLALYAAAAAATFWFDQPLQRRLRALPRGLIAALAPTIFKARSAFSHVKD